MGNRAFSKRYLYRRHDVVSQYTAKLKAIRSKKEIAEELRRAEEKRAAEEKHRTEEWRLAEERRIAEEKRRAEERRLADERRVADEKRRAEEMRKIKYPFSNKIAGIELQSGLLSGLSREWMVREGHFENMTDEKFFSSHYGGKFHCNKQYGIVHSVEFEIKGDSASVAHKIAEYKKKFPDLKHTRKAEQDEKTISRDDGQATIRWTIYTDVLESDRVIIVIISNVSNNLDVTMWDVEMSKLEKKKFVELLKKPIRDEYEKTADVAITDKAMKKYFESLKK